MLKKTGGLLLNGTGAKVELPPGCCTGRKDRMVSCPLPAGVRAYACPWLGPNLRLASDVQMLWSPTKMKKPCTVFVPFTYSCARDLTTEEATQLTEEKIKENSKS